MSFIPIQYLQDIKTCFYEIRVLLIQNSGWGENSTKHPEATRPSNSEPIHKSNWLTANCRFSIEARRELLILWALVLIDPGVHTAAPFSDTIREPKSNFLLSTLHCITAMNDIPEQDQHKKNKSGVEILLYEYLSFVTIRRWQFWVLKFWHARSCWKKASPADFNAEISSNGSRFRLGRICSSNDLASSCHNSLSLPHHSDNWAWDDVLNQRPKKRLSWQVRVVLLCKWALHLNQLQGCKQAYKPVSSHMMLL